MAFAHDALRQAPRYPWYKRALLLAGLMLVSCQGLCETKLPASDGQPPKVSMMVIVDGTETVTVKSGGANASIAVNLDSEVVTQVTVNDNGGIKKITTNATISWGCKSNSSGRAYGPNTLVDESDNSAQNVSVGDIVFTQLWMVETFIPGSATHCDSTEYVATMAVPIQASAWDYYGNTGSSPVVTLTYQPQ